ncbi:MAG: EamA family transporter [Candidatus Magasanikbacteria bacterium]|jgi:transporter family protein
MTWLLYSLLAGLFFALSRVVARLVLREEGNPLAFTAIHDFISGLVLLPLLLAGFHLPQHNITWLFFLGVVIFAFLSDWLTFIALKKINVSVYQITNQVRHIFVLVGGLLLFSEAVTQYKIVAVILIIVGVIVMLYEKAKIHWSVGIWITIFSTLCAVIAFFFVKYAVVDFSETAMASLELLSIGLISFGLLGFNGKKIFNELKINKWGLIISGALFGLFELFLFFALKAGEVSKVIPVTQSALVFGVILGIGFLKERERLVQKIIGTILIILGIVFMNFV